MLDISKSFTPSSESLGSFFRRPGVGYYIPLYQRQYSWDSENIDQLMEDICSGVKSLLVDDDAIHFMGTAILLQESDARNNIRPIDGRALPQRIDNVIDGQQRISTIALLATLLYQSIFVLEKKALQEAALEELKDEFTSKLSILEEFFSVDLMRGTPSRKPVIIRGADDQWILEGDNNQYYKSDLSNYIATVIDSIHNKTDFIVPLKGTLVARNLRRARQWLKNVENAHKLNTSEEVFPGAVLITTSIQEEYLWSYPRPDLLRILEDGNNENFDLLSRVVQYFSFFYFLVERCCFTLIEPVSENWAFDMFQSLNATGTPLTAIETFKPLVVNHFEHAGGFKGSGVEANFTKIDKFLDQATANKKNRLTNEYLTTFRLVIDGGSLSTQFSAQRSWLNLRFRNSLNKEEFIGRASDLADYWENVLNFEPHKDLTIVGLERCDEEDRRLAAFCALFLRDAGHKMANTILGRFYSMVLRNKGGAEKGFVDAVKATTAFFVLWRAAWGNSGLDDVYRKLMKGDDTVQAMSWAGDPGDLTIDKLKNYFKSVLALKGIGEEQHWQKKALQNLRYDHAKYVCKFALFVAAHDTVPDSTIPGLMKKGTPGLVKYLCPNQWVSAEFKTVEHVAPQKGSDYGWDPDLYVDEDFQKIGNLTLLPTSINSSASNKGWSSKILYFRHLAESDPGIIASLQDEAIHNQIELAPSTIELLKNTTFKHHLLPIINGADDITWNKDFVEKRSLRICTILWDRVAPWLE